MQSLYQQNIKEMLCKSDQQNTGEIPLKTFLHKIALCKIYLTPVQMKNAKQLFI